MSPLAIVERRFVSALAVFLKLEVGKGRKAPALSEKNGKNLWKATEEFAIENAIRLLSSRSSDVMIRLPNSTALHRVALVLVVSGLVGCGREDHPTTFPVRGQVFVHAKPAVGAVVILHPFGVDAASQATAWPAGYPRGYVGEDGSFMVSAFDDEDGAPAGEYTLLVHWPMHVADAAGDAVGPDSDHGPQDRLGGRYLRPDASPLRRVVEERSNDWGRLDLP